MDLISPNKNVFIVCILIFFCCYFFYYSLLTWNFEVTKSIGLRSHKMVFNYTCQCNVTSTIAIGLRSWKWNWFKENVSEKSLCNSDVTALGLHQKVISFSLFLSPQYASLPSDSIHFNGIYVNAKELQKYYPDWQIRIYTYSHPDFNRPLCELLCLYPDVFICDIENLPRIGNISGVLEPRMWRFMPLVDPTVEIFISRDLDSSFSDRELAAVNEWIKSNYTFHVMRDHPYHDAPMLAGMWGAKSDQLDSSMKMKYEEAMLTNGTNNGSYINLKSYDQDFLAKHVYPLFKNDLMAHDSYFCEKFKEGFQPFPVKRQNSTDFVGNYIFSPNDCAISNQCPEPCRPSYGKDWEFC